MPRSSPSTGWRRCLLRRDGHPRPDALLALDHDALARLDPFLDDGEPIAAGAEADPALLHLVVGADDEHVGPGLVDGYGSFRDDHNLVAALLLDDDANRLAAGQNVVRIGEHCPDRLTVGAWIDLDIEKIDASLLAIERAIGQS